GPPVTRRWPSVSMISSWPLVSSIGRHYRKRARVGGGAGLTTARGSGNTGILQLHRRIPEPFGNLRFAALREEIRDTPIPLRPREIFTQGCCRLRLRVRVFLGQVLRPVDHSREPFRASSVVPFRTTASKPFSSCISSSSTCASIKALLPSDCLSHIAKARFPSSR